MSRTSLVLLARERRCKRRPSRWFPALRLNTLSGSGAFFFSSVTGRQGKATVPSVKVKESFCILEEGVLVGSDRGKRGSYREVGMEVDVVDVFVCWSVS
jgi:hypothetical protein